MTVTLNPQLQRFIDEQVKAGRFASTAEALEAGVARLMLDPLDSLDQQDLADIRQSLAEIECGEVLDADELHARLKAKYLNE